jgi:hypothetical protein
MSSIRNQLKIKTARNKSNYHPEAKEDGCQFPGRGDAAGAK